MANNYKHTKTVIDTVKIKGYISSDDTGMYITYEKDNDEYTIDVLELFSMFSDSGQCISITLSTKDELDLEG